MDPRRIAAGGDSAGGYLSTTVSYLVKEDRTLPKLKLQILIYPWTQCLDFHFPSYQKYTKEFQVQEGIVCRELMVEWCAFHAWGSSRPELSGRMMTNGHVGPSFKKSLIYQQTLGHDLLPDIYRDSSYYQGPSPSDEGDEEFWQDNKHIFLDPLFTPHFLKNMTGLPTAYVMTAGLDTLRDEGYLYGQQLKKAGVDVTFVHYEKAWHGVHWISPTFRFAVGDRVHDDFLEFTKKKL